MNESDTTEETKILDVRSDINEGREPFMRIMHAVAELKTGQRMLVRTPFRPLALFSVLSRQGFSHEARLTASGDWEVLFTRCSGDSSAPGRGSFVVPSPVGGPAVVEIDVRGLEPPQPLITILESIERLPEGQQLRARTDRRPVHLYAHLEERGFIAGTEEQPDGSFLTTIRRG